MDQNAFWALIGQTSVEANGVIDKQVTALVRELSRLTIEDIIQFEGHLVAYTRMAYDARLFAAGNLLDELSDDGFIDFRFWLILRGQEAYFKCLEDPEALTEIANVGQRGYGRRDEFGGQERLQ
jgi:hypothetical protein